MAKKDNRMNNEVGSFYQEIMEKSKNCKPKNGIDPAREAIDNIKSHMRFGYYNRKVVRMYMNGVKIEGVRKYFTDEGFTVTCEQKFCKYSNNTGNQYTKVTITW